MTNLKLSQIVQSSASPWVQNGLALLILLIIAGIGIVINPEGPNGVQGIFLPHQNYLPVQRPVDASSVQVLNLYPQGQEDRNMGMINTSVHFDVLSDQNNLKLYQESLDKAKYLAAQAGATAIYVIHTTAGGAPGSPLNSFATQIAVLK